MTARLGRRLRNVAAAVADPAADRREQLRREWTEKVWDERRAVLERIDADLRPAVLAALADMDRSGVERPAVADWVSRPVSAGSGATLPKHFPRALVEFLLTDPDVFLGHDCGRCGLTVPIWFVRDSRHTADVIREHGGTLAIFPACPACGGATGYNVYYHAHQDGGGVSPVARRAHGPAPRGARGGSSAS